jgi:hypothetical protein
MQIQPGWTPAQRNEASKAYGDFQKRIMTLPGRFNPSKTSPTNNAPVIGNAPNGRPVTGAVTTAPAGTGNRPCPSAAGQAAAEPVWAAHRPRYGDYFIPRNAFRNNPPFITTTYRQPAPPSPPRLPAAQPQPISAPGTPYDGMTPLGTPTHGVQPLPQQPSHTPYGQPAAPQPSQPSYAMPQPAPTAILRLAFLLQPDADGPRVIRRAFHASSTSTSPRAPKVHI